MKRLGALCGFRTRVLGERGFHKVRLKQNGSERLRWLYEQGKSFVLVKRWFSTTRQFDMIWKLDLMSSEWSRLGTIVDTSGMSKVNLAQIV